MNYRAGDRRQEHLELEPAALARHAAGRHPVHARSTSSCASRIARRRSCAIRPRARCRRCWPTGRPSGTAWPSWSSWPRRTPRPGSGRRHRAARALARSVSAEMHSGFAALRDHCPMDLLARAADGAPAGAGRRRRAPHRGACGATAGAGSAPAGPSCSAPSRRPMPCMRRSPRAFAPIAGPRRPTATTARRKPTSTPCSRCRPWPNGRSGARRDDRRWMPDTAPGQR